MQILKKIISVLVDIAFYGMIAISVLVLILKILGYNIYTCPTGSMEPYIHENSVLVINERANYYSVSEGDVIVYERDNDGKRIVHRAVDINEHGIETKGDANGASDGRLANPMNFIGKFVFAIPYLGKMTQAINTTSKKLLIAFIIVTASVIKDFLKDKKMASLKEENSVAE